MSLRAVPAAVVLVAALAGIVVTGRGTEPAPQGFFSRESGAWMPAVEATGTSLTGSWFCPGVPATGEGGVGGTVVVSNREETQLEGRYTIITGDGVVTERDIQIEPWSQSRIDVDATVSEPSDFASVVVEIEGGGGLVEQVARHPDGDSVAACSNDTSANWYLADGFTVDGSTDTLVLTNPFDESVQARLRFSTESREAQPSQFRSFIVAPRTVRTIPIAELGARDEPVIAVSVEATTGRLVVGRAQHDVGGGRNGYTVSLAAPELRDQWWFADGERADGITETYSIYNPTDDEVEVTVFFGAVPLDAGVEDLDPIVVGPRRVVVFDPYADASPETPAGDGTADDDAAEGDEGEAEAGENGDVFTDDTVDDDGSSVGAEEDADDAFVDFDSPGAELPLGRHSTVFSTLAQPSIVVERVLTRPTDDGGIATSVVMGGLARQDAYVASRWHLGIGPQTPTEEAIVVWNIDQSDATVTVEAVGPGGPTVVESLREIPLRPGSIITIDLTDPDVLNRELIVTSTSRVFVERLLPRGGDLDGRSGSFLLPADL